MQSRLPSRAERFVKVPQSADRTVAVIESFIFVQKREIRASGAEFAANRDSSVIDAVAERFLHPATRSSGAVAVLRGSSVSPSL